MKRQRLHHLTAFFLALSASVHATIVTLDGIGLASNADLPLNFASNLDVDIPGATVTNGATPNVSLVWSPSPNVWEVHGSAVWDNLDAGTGTDVVQLDVNGGEADPSILFIVPVGVALQLNSLDIGHAADQTEVPYGWTITLHELGGPAVLTNTTAVMGPGDVDFVSFQFLGEPGKSYILRFDDGGADTVRAAIDNLNFNQVGTNLTNETTLVFNGLSGPINTPVPTGFGSNLSASGPGAVVTNGGTPDIALTWSPSGTAPNRWEVHGTAPFLALDSTSGNGTVTVAQIESGDTRSITFTTTERAILHLHSIDIGHASDQRTDGSEPAFTWTLTLSEVGGESLLTHTTVPLHGAATDPAPATEHIDFNFTGEPGTDYVLTFTPSGNGANYALRAAIDNLRFGQESTPLQLKITMPGSTLQLQWNSTSGKLYDLLSSTNSFTQPSGWSIYDPDGADGNEPFTNIASAGALTTLTNVSQNGAGRLFVVVEKDPPPPTVMVIAHRGDSLNAPENTLAAIDTAASTADMTEFDVRTTSDGELVLMHDTTIDRTTDGTGAIASMTLAQVRVLDAGSWFSPAFEDEPVPSLAEAIAKSLSDGLVPVIERKAGSAAAYHAAFIEAGLDPTDFKVIAFDPNFLAALHALEPAYELGLLSGAPFNQQAIDQARANGADFMNWNHSNIDQAAVDLARINGMPLFVYTVNDAARMQALIDFGIHGITTDNPALLRSLLP